jgi:Concanavalin A-like lectin/glucanases superfamily
MSGITITGSVTINQGVSIDTRSPTLMLSLDAASYDDTTTGTQQNVSGTSDNIGFFPYGWPAYSVIQPGWTCVQTGAVVSAIDGTAHTITTVGTAFTSGSSYSFTGANSWIDSVNNLPFILQNGVTYDSGDGGSMVFVPSSNQYAQSASIAGLTKWTVETWHYYAGTNTGTSPCILTEVFGGGGINYTLGAINNDTSGLCAGWYNGGGWVYTGTSYNLTPGNWYQIVGTYDGTSVKLYVNNTLVATGGSPGSAFGSGYGIRLMRRWDNAEFWGGKLGIVNIYDGAMNQAEVTSSWNTNKARFGLTAPTLDITSHNFPSGNPNGSITFNITDQGGSPITETGVIFGLPGQTTYAISVDTCTGSSTTAERTAIRTGGCPGPYTTGLTGSQTVSFNASEFVYPSETINVLAYAVNSFGVAYSPTVLSWTPGVCLAEGTLITLADGTSKAIENIEMFDSLKVWDFDNGVFATANPLWIKQEETTSHYNLLTFSDGSTLKTINQHRIFNKQAGAFTHPMTDDTPIGTITVNEYDQEVTLVDKIVVSEIVNYYNVITDYHMNLYANGILTSLRFNNVYHIDEMKFVKDDRELRSLSEFSDIDSRWVDGLRLREQQQPIELINKYVARLERLESEMSYA